MININDFKEFVFFVMNKEGKGSVSPSEFNIATNSALRTWTMTKYGNDAEYQPNMPVPRRSWQITQKITDDLKHLLEFRPFIVENGSMKLPNGLIYDLDGNLAPSYLHCSSLNFDYYQNNEDVVIKKVPLKIITDSEFSLIQSSEINRATQRFPKATFRSDRIEILPTTIQKVFLSYLRQPYDSVWNYTLVDNRPVYDPVTSIDLDAPQEAFNEIAMLVLNLMGMNLRDADVTQYSQGKTQQGV